MSNTRPSTPTPSFADHDVPLDVLRERAYNFRWATLPADVIALTAADPDFPAAPEVRAAITDYTRAGVFSYGPPEGLPEFRSAAARVVTERKGIDCAPEQILATDGAAAGMFAVARWALGPGDEAIIFDPVDFLFARSVEAAGGRVVRARMDPGSGTFDPDELRRLITPRTRLLGVCNPHNPLGRVLCPEELRALGTLAVEHDLWIMNDEVWSDIVYPPHRHIHISTVSPEVAARTVSVYGFSKTFGLAGLRAGFLVVPDEATFEALAAPARSTAAGASTLSQVAATAAYEHAWPWAESFLLHLREMRDYAADRLNRMPGVRCRAPEGTYVLFPDVSALGMDAESLVETLRERWRVAVVPGSPRFFGPGAEGHLRICFSTSRGILSEGLDRIEEGLRRL